MPANVQRKVPREIREAQMLEEARRIFAERGFASASMDEIAEACGVTKPMVYAYFGSKEGLFMACVREAAEDLYVAVRRAAEESPTNELRLWRGFNAVLRFVEDNREAWKVLYPAGPAAVGGFAEGARVAEDRMAALLAELFRDQAVAQGVGAEAAEETEALAHGVTGATVAVATWWQEKRPEEPRELQAVRLMNIVWAGMSDVIEGHLWMPEEG